MTNDDSEAAPADAHGDQRLERTVTVVIRLAGVLALFAGLAMATRDLVTAAYMVQLMDLYGGESDASAPVALAMAVGSSLSVSAWGLLLFFLGRPAARLVAKIR